MAERFQNGSQWDYDWFERLIVWLTFFTRRSLDGSIGPKDLSNVSLPPLPLGHPYQKVMRWNMRKIMFHLSRWNLRSYCPAVAEWTFRLALIAVAILGGLAWYQRTINMWQLKNIGDTFISKDIGTRQIILGTFIRPKHEQNIDGRYAVIHFLGDGRMEHPLYCFSKQPDNNYLISHATVQRINRGKRAANDVCSWAGHIAECQIEVHAFKEFRISATPFVEDSMVIQPEPALKERHHDLVVCVAPMYIYTDWEIMLTGIETWLALGATKIIVPIQSASTSTYKILQEYEKRGIEESHVNCLFLVKPFADLVVFTDIDDMLLPHDPLLVKPSINLQILREIFEEHPQAGSLLFEHRDTQFALPPPREISTLETFNFDFLLNSKTKQNCNVWRMKTRVAVNASRVDSVNMHETGIHRFGFVQTRVPCSRAHFYHLRHSHNSVASAASIDMSSLVTLLNKEWQMRIQDFDNLKEIPLNKSSTESFEVCPLLTPKLFQDFDRCMSAINEEHWGMKVSRCLTPHVCFSRLKRSVECVASSANYSFFRSGVGYFIQPQDLKLGMSEENCEAPEGRFTLGNHYFSP